jgi:predicted MFS family arabinose efflux permease
MNGTLFLAAGMFALGLDAYVVAGLLPSIGHDFHISTAQSGQAVTVFTLCYALAAPCFSVLLVGKPVRNVLVAALAIFSMANAAGALAGSFVVLLITRAIAGLGAGLFAPVAIAAAAALASPGRQGRALGVTLGGMSTGTVIGVPLGLLISEHLGWQGALWLVAGIGAAGLLGVRLGLPDISTTPPPSLRKRLSMVADRRIAATVSVSFLTAAASLGLYTYRLET